MKERKIYKKSIRFEESLMEKIIAEAKQIGISESEYIRRKVSNDIIPDDRETFRAIRRELGAIGNNINQIAHKMNLYTFNTQDFITIENMKKEIFEIRKKMDVLAKKYE